jgi:serine/threonine protein kinase
MPIATSKTLVGVLERVPLLSADQQAALNRELLPGCSDPQSLARQLLQRGWLTPYQINRLLADRAGELVVGPYILLERLGEGGAGQVFKARHQHMNRLVALKLVRKDALADKETVGRFQREIQALAQLEHPNVIHAYDAGPAGSNFFLAMEYVEGVDLQRLVKEKGPLPVEQACDYIRQAACGLAYIHERGLVHRDIKPSNLLLAQAHGLPSVGLVKILDLGLARPQKPVDNALTGMGAVAIGTLDYMSPEQALDFHTADIRADIYSLGCTFYYLLAGRAPFEGGTAAQILLAHQRTEPPPLEPVRPDVFLILRRMIAKSPEDRFQTPEEVKDALEAVQAGGPVTRRASPGSLTATLGRPTHRLLTWRAGARRRPVLVAAGAAGLLVICLALVMGFRSSRPVSSSRADALTVTTATRPVPGPVAYLLHVDKGERTTDVGSSRAIVTQTVDSPELGGKAMKVVFPTGDSIGVSSVAVRNWKPFAFLRMDILNPSKEPMELWLTIRHGRTTNYPTRIDRAIALKPGKNEIRFPIDKLANVNGTAPDLAHVVRWYFSNQGKKPATLYFGNIWLEGSSSSK